jgi:hypothetical protein
MKNSGEALVSELMSRLNEEEQKKCQRIIDCLTGLGYVPHKENVKNFVLSFKNREVGQTIAKLGLRSGKNNGLFYSIKFYACKNPPQKFSNAVREAVIRSNGQYACSDCGVCGAGQGERGYHCLLPDGTARAAWSPPASTRRGRTTSRRWPANTGSPTCSTRSTPAS